MVASRRFARSVVACGVVLLGARATAQGLLVDQGRFVVAEGLPVPGLPGATFGGTVSIIAIDTGAIDEAGRVLFRGRFTGAGATALDDRAYFVGYDANDLAIVVRGGDAAPGLPGLTLNTATAAGLGGSPRLAPTNDALFFGGSLSGAGVTTANDTALFAGAPGVLQLVAREGDAAVGTAGAIYSSTFGDPTYSTTGVDGFARVLFTSSLAGGDVVGTTNNSALYTGLPGALTLLMRKGASVAGGQVAATLGFVNQMNALGQVLHDVTYSTTLGAPAASTGNDRAVYVYDPFAGDQLLVREGQAAPGTLGATFNNASNSWAASFGGAAFNAAGQAAFSCDLAGGDVVGTTNEKAIYVGAPGALALAVRKGAPAPGTTAVFGNFGNGSVFLNDSGAIAFHNTLTGTGVTLQNDTSLWAGQPGALALVAREGDVAPGTGGGTFLNIQSNIQIAFNNRGQMLFVCNVMIAGNPTQCFFGWDPVVGLTLMLQTGIDALETTPGVFKTANSVGFLANNNGGGAPLGFNHAGEFVVRLTMNDAIGSGALLRGYVGAMAGAPRALSAAAGGVHTFFLNGGAARANEVFFLAGSAAGAAPGFPYGPFLVPLNPDAYFAYTIANPNLFPYANSLGVLDGFGRATATFTLPPGLGILAGLALDHAYVTFDAALQPTSVGGAVRLEFLP